MKSVNILGLRVYPADIAGGITLDSNRGVEMSCVSEVKGGGLMQSAMVSVHRHKYLYHVVIPSVCNLKQIFHSFTVSKSLLASVKMNCSGICMGYT